MAATTAKGRGEGSGQVIWGMGALGAGAGEGRGDVGSWRRRKESAEDLGRKEVEVCVFLAGQGRTGKAYLGT